MSKHVKLKRGYDLNLKGRAANTLGSNITPDTYAVKPTDFPGMQRAKALVSEGQNVKAGTPLFIDKKLDSVIYTSPVSGEVAAINRGAKRAIQDIVILADREVEYEQFDSMSASDIHNVDRARLVELLRTSGVWPQIIQRPFGVVANPEQTPKSIFISGFDSHPLAPDEEFMFNGEGTNFQTGLDVLKKLTDGDVYLGLNGTGEIPSVYSQVRDVQVNKFSGPHPAGNVGVQIHHTEPINKGDLVWTVSPYGVIQIGKLVATGKYDASKVIAITGSEVDDPKYYKTHSGASVKKFIDGNLNSDHVRIISGNVFTGENIGADGYLGYYHQQFTVIPEGDSSEFFGWIAPTTSKPSYHRAFGLLSFLNGKKEFAPSSNTNGGPRAFVMTGAFENVTPMDIYPTYLIKAILAEDYDDMEALGIYEVIEEDLAICEFIDVSKHDIQSIVRSGIDLMIHS